MKTEKYNANQKIILPIFIVTGDDTIGRHKAKKAFYNQFYHLYKNGVEVKFDSSATTFDSFIERILTPSLFQEPRIFTIRHAQFLTEKDREKLEYILTLDLPNEYILIEFEKEKGKKKLLDSLGIKKKIKQFPNKILYLPCEKPPDYKIAEWLTQQVPLLFNRTVSKANAEYLVSLVGTELDKLYSELEKFDIFLSENQPINKSIIKEITGNMKIRSPFELADSLGKKDMTTITEIVDSLFLTNFYAPPVIAIIFRHFWNLLKIKAFANENSNLIQAYYNNQYSEKMKIAHTIGIATGLLTKTDPIKKAYPVIILSNIIDQVRNYSFPNLNSIFTLLKDFDVGIKTGRVTVTKQSFLFLCYSIYSIKTMTNQG